MAASKKRAAAPKAVAAPSLWQRLKSSKAARLWLAGLLVSVLGAGWAYLGQVSVKNGGPELPALPEIPAEVIDDLFHSPVTDSDKASDSAAGSPPPAAPAPPIEAPQSPPPPAPPTAMRLEISEDVDLSKPELNRRVLVFWANWCGPCLAERPKIEKLCQEAGISCGEHNSHAVQFINVDASPQYAKFYGATQGIPLAVLVDLEGTPLQKEKGELKTLAMIAKLGPPRQTFARGSIGTLDGAREKILALIELLRPLLFDGGTVQIDYRIPSGALPAITLAGKTIRLENPTTLVWSLQGDVLRCELQPPASISVKGFPVSIRGVKVSPDRVVVDIPWLPDATIDVR